MLLHIFKQTDWRAKDVTVTLKGDGVDQSYVTNAFGDFWFEDLKSKENYTVEIAHDGYKKISLNVQTYSDVKVGDLFLDKTA